MWAKYLNEEPDDYVKETNAEDFDTSADDKMPEPTAEAPPAPVVVPAPVPSSAPSSLPVTKTQPAPPPPAPPVLGGVWHPPDYTHQEKALGSY